MIGLALARMSWTSKSLVAIASSRMLRLKAPLPSRVTSPF
jgi:hypothetical protein